VIEIMHLPLNAQDDRAFRSPDAANHQHRRECAL
jgi:hypothetical protein